MVAPVSRKGILGLRRAEIRPGIRAVVLCKDVSGKLGLRIKAIHKVSTALTDKNIKERFHCFKLNNCYVFFVIMSLFAKLPRPGDSEGIFVVFESSCHLPTCLLLKTKEELAFRIVKCLTSKSVSLKHLLFTFSETKSVVKLDSSMLTKHGPKAS